MKFTVQCSALNKALKTISPAIRANPIIPISQSLKMVKKNGKTKVYATDMHLSIIADIDVESEEDFEAVIPFRTLYNISSNHKYKLAAISVDAEGVSVLIDGKKFVLGGYENPLHFPRIEDIKDDAEEVELSSEMMYKLQKATSCVALEANGLYKDVFININDGKIEFISTDKFVLFKYSEPIVNKKVKAKASISTAFIKAISDIEYGSIYIDDKNVKIQSIGAIFIGRRTEEVFPLETVNNILSEFKSNCSVDKKDLIEAINDILSYGTSLPLADLIFTKKDKIIVEFNDLDNQYSFNSELNAMHSSKTERLRFNIKQFKNIIDAVEDDEVLLNIPEVGYSVKIINDAGTQKQMIQSLMI